MPMSPQGGLRDNRLSFETDSRLNPIERPTSTWAPEVYSVDLAPLSLDQFSAFQDWYVKDLAFGTRPFVFPHPITRQPGAWKIVKADPPYRVTKSGMIAAGSDRRRVNLSFSIMSQPYDLMTSLFSGGRAGILIEDFNPANRRLFADAAGNVPALLPGGGVGRVRRKAGTVDAIQNVSASRPILIKWPVGGRRNAVTNAILTGLASGVAAPVSDRPGWFDISLPVQGARVQTGNLGGITAGVVLTGSALIDTSAPFGANTEFSVGVSGSFRAYVRVHVPTPGQAPVITSPGTSPAYLSSPTYRTTHVSGSVWRIELTTVCNFATALSVTVQFWNQGAAPQHILAGLLQLETASSATPGQLVITANDVTEPGVPDVWHIASGALPVALPPGEYGRAFVNYLGALTVDSVTNPSDALLTARLSRALLRQGTFTPAEETRIRQAWGGGLP